MTEMQRSSETSTSWQQEFVQVLGNAFAEHQKKNPKFSLRSYASKLSISHGALSDLLRGRATWTVSADRAAELLVKIKAAPATKNKLLVAMKKQPRHIVKAIAAENFKLLTDWTYQPVLAAFDLRPELHQPEVLAKRLGISVRKAKEVIADLLKRGLLVKDENANIKRPAEYLAAEGEAPPDKETIRAYHEIGLQMAQRALKEIPAHRRDITSLTFVGSEKKLENLTREIRKLYQMASATMDEGDANDCVYKMSIQLYPIEFPHDENT